MDRSTDLPGMGGVLPLDLFRPRPLVWSGHGVHIGSFAQANLDGGISKDVGRTRLRQAALRSDARASPDPPRPFDSSQLPGRSSLLEPPSHRHERKGAGEGAGRGRPRRNRTRHFGSVGSFSMEGVSMVWGGLYGRMQQHAMDFVRLPPKILPRFEDKAQPF